MPGGVEREPGGRQVGGGVPARDVPEVHDRGELVRAAVSPGPHDDVARVRVAVQPHGRAGVGRSDEPRGPGGREHGSGGVVGRGRQALREDGVLVRERAASERVGRRVRRRRHVQGREGPAEGRRPGGASGDRRPGGGLALEPGHDAPGVRVAELGRGASGAHGRRDRDGQQGNERGQHRLLALDEVGGGLAAGQAQSKLPAQPHHDVVPAVRGDVEPQVGEGEEVGVLGAQERAGEIGRDVDVGAHAGPPVVVRTGQSGASTVRAPSHGSAQPRRSSRASRMPAVKPHTRCSRPSAPTRNPGLR